MAARFWNLFSIFGTISLCKFQKQYLKNSWKPGIWGMTMADFWILGPTAKQKRAAELEIVQKVIGADNSIKVTMKDYSVRYVFFAYRIKKV